MKKPVYTILFILLISVVSFGQVRLPKLISDGMVLQRNANVKIWGWASNGEKITIHFINKTYRTTANDNGDWNVILSNLKAGGPYNMKIDASNSITIKDILVGDVWVCSGQSNMEFSMRSIRNKYPGVIDSSKNQFIRQFWVPPAMNFNQREKDFRFGKWQEANPQSVLRFTAVGYFFAKYLYEIYKVPIGLINSSYGGSSTEAWLSEDAIKSFPKYYEELQRFQKPGHLEEVEKQDRERTRKWIDQLRQNDKGYKNPKETWFDPNLNTSDWDTTHVPGYWANTKLGPVNGVVWYRRKFNIPSGMIGKPAMLKFGRIVDADSVFINGKFVGGIGSQYAERNYKISGDILKKGENTIVVRIVNYIHHGGFVPGKKYEIIAGDDTSNLAGEWKYRLGAASERLEDPLFAGKLPTGLFNSMLAPLLNYRIKGVVWYQGESNTSRAFEQYDMFKKLIKDWRNNWHQGDFPFLYVQLPNFVEVNIETTKYDWAYFRESQLKALAIPNTGMAVTVDVGEWNDIHPKDKKDVGYRLSLVARKVAYDEKNIVYSGPIYKSMKIEGSKIILSFDHVGSGLVAKTGGKLKWFEICGRDDEFFPAEAKIENNKIVVWSNKVSAPVAVRYAWSNNPEGANLYNKEGLPASPFRTSDLY
jgi:sialate O-acetylesterase